MSADRLARLREITDELDAAERDAAGWRQRRNKEILRLRKLKDPPTITEIARTAKIQHGFVSRIVKGDGVPASGHNQATAAQP